ncbi:MAG: ABC transporter permease [Planctomycetes bacterium]|nr:ABC transporter permease [Planctomycetota bacterium]
MTPNPTDTAQHDRPQGDPAAPGPAAPAAAHKPIESSDKVAFYEASQWQLMWRRFSKHKMALWCLHIITVLYVVCLSAPFFAPHNATRIHSQWVNQPPMVFRFGFVEGHTLPRLYFHPFVMERHPVTRAELHQVDWETRVPVRFFVKGRQWRLLGVIPTRLHFFGTDYVDPELLEAQGRSKTDQPAPPLFPLGTGQLGQCVLSRILYGGRISLLLGLTGVFITFFLGILLGGISGYYGGKIDMVIQRLAEMLQSVPKIPLWLALAAAIPKNWTSLQVYFGMTLILACMGWTGMCRTVRGKLLSLREEDYARAALIAGASERRVIFTHLIPNFFSHIIASLTLAVPGMILAETSLSFLGLGLRPPMVSWGVLLQEARDPGVVLGQPWLLAPALAVVITVLALNFTGEGLRDAADPYST